MKILPNLTKLCIIAAAVSISTETLYFPKNPVATSPPKAGNTADSTLVKIQQIPSTMTFSGEPVDLTDLSRQENLDLEVDLFPERLFIDKISLNAPIVVSDKTPEGEMEVPPDDATIGWWKYGAKPGEIGSSVLAGHYTIDSGAPGVFFDLNKMSVGDEIRVEMTDGSMLIYIIAEMKYYGLEEFPLHEFFTSNDLPRLNIITCAGEYVESIDDFSHRLAVYAVLK